MKSENTPHLHLFNSLFLKFFQIQRFDFSNPKIYFRHFKFLKTLLIYSTLCYRKIQKVLRKVKKSVGLRASLHKKLMCHCNQ